MLYHARHRDVPALVTGVYADHADAVDLTAFYPETYDGLDDAAGQRRAPIGPCRALTITKARQGGELGMWSWPTMVT